MLPCSNRLYIDCVLMRMVTSGTPASHSCSSNQVCYVQFLARRTARRKMGHQCRPAAAASLSASRLGNALPPRPSRTGVSHNRQAAPCPRSMACTTSGASSLVGISRQCTILLPACQPSGGAPFRCQTWTAAALEPSHATPQG